MAALVMLRAGEVSLGSAPTGQAETLKTTTVVLSLSDGLANWSPCLGSLNVQQCRAHLPVLSTGASPEGEGQVQGQLLLQLKKPSGITRWYILKETNPFCRALGLVLSKLFIKPSSLQSSGSQSSQVTRELVKNGNDHRLMNG